jgi:hypothetical protein
MSRVLVSKQGMHGMNALAYELGRAFERLDSETAVLLERAVRDALALAERRATLASATDSMGYPVDYFETTAGSFADEPLEPPDELPLETRESW